MNKLVDGDLFGIPGDQFSNLYSKLFPAKIGMGVFSFRLFRR